MLHDLTGPIECYVDESIQRECGFVATAFVFGHAGLDAAVAEVLERAGLAPGRDEFKSGARMDANPTLRQVRADLMGLAGQRTRLAVVFSSAHRRDRLGQYALQALQSVLVRNGVARSGLTTYFDSGIFADEPSASVLQKHFSTLAGVRLHVREDSKKRLGIQVADVVAHTFGQVLRESVAKDRKRVHFGPDDSLPLSEVLLSPIRFAIFRRHLLYGSRPHDPACDPIVVTSEDDLMEMGPNAEVFGWGVQVAPDLPDDLRTGVRAILERVWLGCYH